jgi:hypothetical protein
MQPPSQRAQCPPVSVLTMPSWVLFSPTDRQLPVELQPIPLTYRGRAHRWVRRRPSGVRGGGYGRTVRVSVLVDAFNLYYAGRKLCGRGVAGWRWLDVRSLARALVAEQAGLWPGARVERVVYCTARISGAANPSGAADQDVYVKGLSEW